MSQKAIAVVFLLPITFVLLTSCGPTEGERQRHEIARQDSLARIRADSIAMAFNQNIDQAGDIRSLMEQTRKPADVASELDSIEVDQPPAESAETNAPARAERQIAVNTPEPEKEQKPAQTSAAPVQQSHPAEVVQTRQAEVQQSRPAEVQQASTTNSATTTNTASRPLTSGASAVHVNVMDELAPSVTGGRYTVQLGTWRNEDLAQAEIERLHAWGLTNTRLIRLEVNQHDGLFYIIRMGRYDDLTTARQQANYLNMEYNKEAVVIDLSPSS